MDNFFFLSESHLRQRKYYTLVMLLSLITLEILSCIGSLSQFKPQAMTFRSSKPQTQCKAVASSHLVSLLTSQVIMWIYIHILQIFKTVITIMN